MILSILDLMNCLEKSTSLLMFFQMIRLLYLADIVI